MDARSWLDRRRRGATLGSAAVLTLLVTCLPGLALAQDPSAPPSAPPAPPESATAAASPVAVSTAPAAASPSSAASPGATSAVAGPAFPSTLAGAPLDVESYDGAQWLAQFQDGTTDNEAFAKDTAALLESLGKGVDDLHVRSALAEPTLGSQAVILALQVDGTEARDFATGAVDLLLGDITDPGFALRPLGSRWVLRVVDAAVPGVYPRTVYLAGDTAWIIGADEEYVMELLEQLPAQPYTESIGDAVLAGQLPVVLDGRRRIGLYEAREPLFLPALESRAGPTLDAWLLDLYLEDGLTPTDLVGAIAWWGVESSEDSVEVEGYQVPDGSPELVESLRTRVFLGDGQPLPDEVTRTDHQLGDRAVTTFDLRLRQAARLQQRRHRLGRHRPRGRAGHGRGGHRGAAVATPDADRRRRPRAAWARRAGAGDRAGRTPGEGCAGPRELPASRAGSGRWWLGHPAGRLPLTSATHQISLTPWPVVWPASVSPCQ